MTLRNFADVLDAANSQPEPQRLLLVFAAAELPPGALPAQRIAFEQGEGGVLEPKLCVDKLPVEIANFAELVRESEIAGIPWSVLFVGSLPGRAGYAPSNDEAIQPLRLMVSAIRGGRLANFLAVNREGELIQLHSG